MIYLSSVLGLDLLWVARGCRCAGLHQIWDETGGTPQRPHSEAAVWLVTLSSMLSDSELRQPWRHRTDAISSLTWAGPSGTIPVGFSASRFSGKVLRVTVKDNPRRPGTHGYRSFEILRAHPEGMIYEDYIAAGGRTNDLQWDIDRNWATVFGFHLQGVWKREAAW